MIRKDAYELRIEEVDLASYIQTYPTTPTRLLLLDEILD